MKRMMAGTIALLLGFATPVLAHAAHGRIQASMLVSGTITVSPQGTVETYTLDKPGKLPVPVVQLLTRSVPHWRFEPVRRHGRPVSARATMHLRVVAKPVGTDTYNIRIAGSWFGNGHSDQLPRFRHRSKPYYPRAAIQSHVSGTVYLMIEMDRTGHVEHVIARQVDLRVRGMPALLRQWRHVLARSAVHTARHWTFNVPTAGDQAGQDHWIVQMPVDFRLRGAGIPAAPGYGQWDAYIPGPVHTAPWCKQDDVPGKTADAVPVGGLYAGRSSLHRIDAPRS